MVEVDLSYKLHQEKKIWVSFAMFIRNFLNVYFFFYLAEELFPLELLFFMPCNAYQEKKMLELLQNPL